MKPVSIATLRPVPEAVVRNTYTLLLEQTELYAKAHFDALKRILDREEPGYKN